MTVRNISLRNISLVGLGCVLLGATASSQLQKLLMGGGVAVAVDKFGPDINKGIDQLTGDKNLKVAGATKVVPILSIGSGESIGAVQVAGPAAQVAKVKAVVQLETGLKLLVKIRVKALVPIESKSISNIRRVPNVGISALVDIKL